MKTLMGEEMRQTLEVEKTVNAELASEKHSVVFLYNTLYRKI